MSLPTLLFGFLISTLTGAGFHLLKGGGAGRFLLYLITGWVGFWAGQFIARTFNLTFISVGSLHLGLAVLTSLAFILIGHWLSLVETDRG